MTEIIALLARKGSAGKTMLSGNIAAALRRRGHSVLIVESDGQGNATELVGLPKRDDFYDLILGDADFADVIRSVPFGFAEADAIDILSAYNMQWMVEKDRDETVAQRIYDRLQEVRGYYDFVIVDTSPGLTPIHNGFYYTADYFLVPTTLEAHSIKSIQEVLNFLQAARVSVAGSEIVPAKLLGIIPNRYRVGTKNSQDGLLWLKRDYRQYVIFERLRELMAWETAVRQERSIYTLDASGDRRLAIMKKQAVTEFEHLVNDILKQLAHQQAEKDLEIHG